MHRQVGAGAAAGSFLLTGSIATGLRRLSPTARNRLIDSYLASMLSRDFVQQGIRLRTYATVNGATLSFLRTQSGHHEVDFILQRGNHVVAVEVKLSPSVKDDDVCPLPWLKEIMGTDLSDAVVLTTGNLAYRRRDGIAVIPAAWLGA